MAKKNTVTQQNSNGKELESMTCFSNPNYLCPDAKTIVERKQQKNKFDETVLPPSVAQLSRDESHQNFAAALNSPAESLITDYQVGIKFYCVGIIKSVCVQKCVSYTIFSQK